MLSLVTKDCRWDEVKDGFFYIFFLLFFGRAARGILASRPGKEPAPPASEGEVLTTGLKGKSQLFKFTNLNPFITHLNHSPQRRQGL